MSKSKILGIVGIIALGILIWRFNFSPAKAPVVETHKLNVSGIVVPHHNIVADLRAQMFAQLAGKIATPQTIILISPNHYTAGLGKIQATNQTWNLGDGQIKPNQKVIDYLLANKLVTNEPSSFTQEHGVYNILADIKKNFPSATLVPIIFEPVTQAELNKVEQGLKQSCPGCLMIASVDFSHYQPALLGDLHDDHTIRDLENLDTSDILTKAEVDSGPALDLLTLWAKDHETQHFNLWNHTNSGIIDQNPDLEATTHVFGWYEPGEKTKPEVSVSFLFGGDMMFARTINHNFSNDFNQVVSQLGDRVFWGTDAAVVNLEGAITTQPIVDNIQTNNFTFYFSPSVVKTLSFLHINAASQANNHSDNAGDEGLATTRQVLSAAQIQTFGGPTSKDATKVATFKGQGLTLKVIGVNLTFGEPGDVIVPLIKQLKQEPNTKVIVMPHWGKEYLTTHTPDQATAAHEWIDAGADLVIGSHPHVIEDTELYHNVPIIYSMGNLLFDQTFSPQVQEGLLIGGQFTPTGLALFVLPTESIKYQPRLLVGTGKKQILDSVYGPFKKYLTPTPAGTMIQMP